MDHSQSKEILETLRGALSVADGDLKLAISGPHVDLVSQAHFYEVHLSSGGREARTRLEGYSLPNGFAYLMESGLGYAEDLICEALSRKIWSKRDPAKELIDQLVDRRAEEMVPKQNKLACQHEVTLDVRVGGSTFGRVVYYPYDPESCRFRFLKWMKGFYRELGSRATLQDATDALLGTQ